jgi:hypothetical protein
VLHLEVVATGGDGGYTYAWAGLPPGCASRNNGTVSCTPTAKGTFSVSVSVGDAAGGTATSMAVAVTVSDPLRPAPLRRWPGAQARYGGPRTVQPVQ